MGQEFAPALFGFAPQADIGQHAPNRRSRPFADPGKVRFAAAWCGMTYVRVGWIFACLLPSDRSIGADIVEAPAFDPFGRQERPLSGTWSSTIESKAGIENGLMVSLGPFDQNFQGA